MAVCSLESSHGILSLLLQEFIHKRDECFDRHVLFYEEVSHSQLLPSFSVFLIAEISEKYDFERPVFQRIFLQNAESVDDWHIDVEHEQIGGFFFYGGDSFFPILSSPNAVARKGKFLLVEIPQERVVLRDENGVGCHEGNGRVHHSLK